jgi:hypothetical protein
MRNLPFGLFSVLASVVVLEGVARLIFGLSNLSNERVDIQSPYTLCAKIDHLRNYKGAKVVLLGDSVVYGSRLERHTTQWRDGSLDANLRREPAIKSLAADVLVMNLGMNGALPVDQNDVLRLLTGARVDLLIMSVNLRSFSGDFADAASTRSRPWLKRVSIDAEGNCDPGSSNDDRTEHTMASFVGANLALMKLAPYMQAYWLDGTPRDAVRASWKQLNERMLETDPDEILVRESFDQMQAAERYQSVDLSRTHPQIQALDTGLRAIASVARSAIVFYAQENPEARPNLLDDGRYHELRNQLDGLVTADVGHNVIYLSEVKELEPFLYADHVHPTAQGYQTLARALARSLEGLQSRRDEPDAR